jgi:hypothetical protein
VSGSGTAAKPRLPFCWVCSRKLHGNFHRVAVVNGLEVVVHAACAKSEGLAIKDGAHKRSGPNGLERTSPLASTEQPK